MYIEKDAFEKLVDKYSDSVYRVAYNYCGNHSDAQDIVQETFLRYIKKQPDLETEEHQRAWLLRVAINLSKDYLKSYWFKNTSELTEDIPIKQDDNKAIWDSVRKLPQKYRIVIELYYKEGYSIKEIADILKKKQATIGTWLSRGKKILEKTLKEDIYG